MVPRNSTMNSSSTVIVVLLLVLLLLPLLDQALARPFPMLAGLREHHVSTAAVGTPSTRCRTPRRLVDMMDMVDTTGMMGVTGAFPHLGRPWTCPVVRKVHRFHPIQRFLLAAKQITCVSCCQSVRASRTTLPLCGLNTHN